MKNNLAHFYQARVAFICVALICVTIPVVSFAQDGAEKFMYINSVYSNEPVDLSLMKVTATGDDGDQINAQVNVPGNRYYEVTCFLDKGVKYDIVFAYKGKTVFTDREVYHARKDPTKQRIGKMILGPPTFMVRNKEVPSGFVQLHARTVENIQDRGLTPNVTVSSANGGKWYESRLPTPLGSVFIWAQPGKEYTIRYVVGGKAYMRQGVVGNVEDGKYQFWTLEHDQSPPPEDPTDPVDECVGRWVWGACVDEKQKGVWDPWPANCSTRPDTSRACAGAADSGFSNRELHWPLGLGYLYQQCGNGNMVCGPGRLQFKKRYDKKLWPRSARHP